MLFAFRSLRVEPNPKLPSQLIDEHQTTVKGRALGGIMRLTVAILIIIQAVLATFLTVFAWRGAPSLSGWEYKDVIGILLTTVTVVVAGLALFLGLAAVWGYQKITEEASKDAIKAMQSYLRSDEFFGIVSSIVSDRMKGDMQAILASRVVTQTTEEAPSAPDEPWVE